MAGVAGKLIINEDETLDEILYYSYYSKTTLTLFERAETYEMTSMKYSHAQITGYCKECIDR